jgi:hypothetical protein
MRKKLKGRALSKFEAAANRRYAWQFGGVGFYHATGAGGRVPSAAVAALGRWTSNYEEDEGWPYWIC